jgi:hypothetical protein
MENQTQQSATTVNHDYRATHLIRDIFEEDFDAEMDWLEIECMEASGQIMRLIIPARHIKRFQLAIQKGQSDKRYFDYISKNY